MSWSPLFVPERDSDVRELWKGLLESQNNTPNYTVIDTIVKHWTFYELSTPPYNVLFRGKDLKVVVWDVWKERRCDVKVNVNTSFIVPVVRKGS